MRELVENLVRTVNAFELEGTLALFAPDAVIDDVSVGDTFVGRDGVRRYVERFFIGYNTTSRILSIEEDGVLDAVVRLDFTGDFGHEVGILRITIKSSGLIGRIDADLE